MQALVYTGPGKQSVEDRAQPLIKMPTDGTQAEYVRIPYADTSLYPIPQGSR